jgi:hypothetical protein
LHTDDASVAGDFGVEGHGIVVLRNFDKPVVPFVGSADMPSLLQFIHEYETPSLSNYMDLYKDMIGPDRLPLLILLTPSTDP